MKRNEFLKGLGLLGAGTLLPGTSVITGSTASAKTTGTTANCHLIPTETEGPFPLDLTTNNSATFFRTDVRENRTGAKLNLTMRIYGIDNCTPMTNARVNIWHCDKDGIYSGYAGGMNQGGSASTTWLRGYQMTDAYGEVKFTTIFPGWYSGRTMHIHFQVYVSSSYRVVSQMTCDVAQKNAVYASNSGLYTKGSDPQSPTNDNIFSDGYQYQLFTLTQNADGSYDGYLEVSVAGVGSGNSGTPPTGIADHHEPETGGQFTLGQNFPNPHEGATTVPFALLTTSKVKLDIYDLQARRIATVDAGTLGAGEHKLAVDFSRLGIASGSYLYQLEVNNSNGTFKQVKMMTAAR